jgi:hypothetical protein
MAALALGLIGSYVARGQVSPLQIIAAGLPPRRLDPHEAEAQSPANWVTADFEAMRQWRLIFSPTQKLKLDARAPLAKPTQSPSTVESN